jgi:hypothetical protein
MSINDSTGYGTNNLAISATVSVAIIGIDVLIESTAITIDVNNS